MESSERQRLAQEPNPTAELDDLEAAKLRLLALGEETDPINLIRRHPLAAVGIAFGVGLLLSAEQRNLQPLLRQSLRLARWWL